MNPCSSGSCGVFYRLKASLPAFVSLLPSYSGRVGKTVEVFGQGFISATTVSFNGALATPTVKASTYLTVAVPNGTTTGFVTVTTSSGTLKSNQQFRVVPQITSFSPSSGPIGALVTITGISLTQTTKVTFGGVSASFTMVNDTTVTATVPSGAKTGKIAITTVGGTAVSSSVFTVSTHNTLDGYCVHGGILSCSASYDPSECPPGAAPIKPGTVVCGFPPLTANVDLGRVCKAGAGGVCGRTR